MVCDVVGGSQFRLLCTSRVKTQDNEGEFKRDVVALELRSKNRGRSGFCGVEANKAEAVHSRMSWSLPLKLRSAQKSLIILSLGPKTLKHVSSES